MVREELVQVPVLKGLKLQLILNTLSPTPTATDDSDGASLRRSPTSSSAVSLLRKLNCISSLIADNPIAKNSLGESKSQSHTAVSSKQDSSDSDGENLKQRLFAKMKHQANEMKKGVQIQKVFTFLYFLIPRHYHSLPA